MVTVSSYPITPQNRHINLLFNPKNASKNAYLLVNISIKANSVDQDQTAPIEAV